MAATEKDVRAIERARSLNHVPWCEEYEVMISGMAFRSWESADLLKAHSKALRLCKEYNQIDYAEEGVDRAGIYHARGEILKSLLGHIGGYLKIETGFRVEYGCNVSVGNNFYANTGLTIDDSAFVTIGDNVAIGPNVQFITINHPTDVEQRLKSILYSQPITIGNNCWIGSRATILPGADIEQGCTIGAGAVVTGRIPEYSVAVGVPARVVKRVHPAREKENQDQATTDLPEAVNGARAVE